MRYSLFSEIEDSGVRGRCIEIAEMFSREHGIRLEHTFYEAFVAMEEDRFQGMVFMFNYRHSKSDDGLLRTDGTFTEEDLRGRGIALDMRLALNEWAKNEGYMGIATGQLNTKMISLFRKLAGEDTENSYSFQGKEVIKVRVTF